MDAIGRLWARETHGRWPWVSAALAAPSSVALWRARTRVLRDPGSGVWVALPALLWHQTEEWVVPGGFLPWFNRTVLGSDRDEFPITRRAGLAINVGLGWGVGLWAALSSRRRPALGALVLGMTAGNAGLHIRESLRQRRYNPGLATSLLVFAPVSVLGLARLAREHAPAAAGGASVGLAVAVGSFQAYKARARRSR